MVKLAAEIYRREGDVVIVAGDVSHKNDRIERALVQLKSPAAVVPGKRPVVVLEFRVNEEAGSENSSFGDALDLARFISGERLQGVQTVAWFSRAASR